MSGVVVLGAAGCSLGSAEGGPERDRGVGVGEEAGLRSPSMCAAGSAGCDDTLTRSPAGGWSGACGREPFGRQFPAESAALRGFAVGDASESLLAGAFEGALTFGSTTLTSAGSTDVFVAKLDACGFPLWSARFGDAEAQAALDVAADGKGALVLGEFEGTVDFGAVRLTASPPGGPELFVANLKANGRTRWAAQFSADDDAILSGTAVASDGRGGALVLGKLEGEATVAGQRIERRALGVFVVRLDRSGHFSWVSLPPSGSDTDEIGLEVDDDGNIFIAAQDGRGNATFLTKLDEDGALLWHQRFRGSPEQVEEAYDLAVDPDGSVLLAGSGVFGDPALPGGPRPFVAKLDPDGNVLWVKRFDGQQRALEVAASDDAVFLAGDSFCTPDVPPSCGSWAAELSPGGDVRWTESLGQGALVSGLELDKRDNPMLAGSFQGTIEVGDDVLTSEEDALFVGRLLASD
ncbi:hypothetical protein WMF43_07705 [Sorangium sp. So ce131]